MMLTSLLAVGGEPASTGSAPDSYTALPVTPYFRIRRDETGTSVTGQISSIAHEAILHDVVSSIASSTVVFLELREVTLLPPGWALVTELALRATLWTRFSEAEVTADEVSIRGVTTDADSWGDARSRLDASLLPGMRLETHVIEVPPIRDYQALCRQQFDAALQNRALEFDIAKSTLESGAEALLDSLLEIAGDCPEATIFLRAGGDGPESAAANRLLAEARSQSVVAHMTARGLAPARINVMPIDDGYARQGRKVTFAVKFPPATREATTTGAASP